MRYKALIVTLLVAMFSQCVHALPFNDDMVKTPQMRTGSMARASVPHTISRNPRELQIPQTRELADASINPIEASELSVRNGKRLFQTNCYACHGQYKDGARELPHAASSFLIVGPDISLAQYASRSDGFFFGTIQYGSYSKLMPAVGWKFSVEESWDIVNYVRSLQKK